MSDSGFQPKDMMVIGINPTTLAKTTKKD